MNEIKKESTRVHQCQNRPKEERICELEDRHFEIIHSEKNKNKK